MNIPKSLSSVLTGVDASVEEVRDEKLHLGGEHADDVGNVVEAIGDEDDGRPPPHRVDDGRYGRVNWAATSHISTISSKLISAS